MNEERFLQFQRAIDDDLLEEAQNYRKEKVNWLRYAALAACFCGVIAGVLAWHPWNSAKNAAVMASGTAASEDSAVAYSVFEAPAAAPAPEAAFDAGETENAARKADPAEAYDEEAGIASAQDYDSVMTFGMTIPNPVRECTLGELAQMGYAITLPETAEPEFISVIGDMANVKFFYDGNEYLLRALKTAAGEDISGVYDTVRKAYSWSMEGTDFEMREGSEGIVFSWYSHDEGTQWCLFSRDVGPEALIKTAGEIRGTEVPAPQE